MVVVKISGETMPYFSESLTLAGIFPSPKHLYRSFYTKNLRSHFVAHALISLPAYWPTAMTSMYDNLIGFSETMPRFLHVGKLF